MKGCTVSTRMYRGVCMQCCRFGSELFFRIRPLVSTVFLVVNDWDLFRFHIRSSKVFFFISPSAPRVKIWLIDNVDCRALYCTTENFLIFRTHHPPEGMTCSRHSSPTVDRLGSCVSLWMPGRLDIRPNNLAFLSGVVSILDLSSRISGFGTCRIFG